jgi:hypothetical protein
MAIVHRTMGNILSNEAAHQSSKNCAALIIEAENNPAPERPVHRSLSCWLKPNRPAARLRYRIIARHYRELADREEQSDRARMAEHLKMLKLKRRKAAE